MNNKLRIIVIVTLIAACMLGWYLSKNEYGDRTIANTPPNTEVYETNMSDVNVNILTHDNVICSDVSLTKLDDVLSRAILSMVANEVITAGVDSDFENFGSYIFYHSGIGIEYFRALVQDGINSSSKQALANYNIDISSEEKFKRVIEVVVTRNKGEITNLLKHQLINPLDYYFYDGNYKSLISLIMSYDIAFLDEVVADILENGIEVTTQDLTYALLKRVPKKTFTLLYENASSNATGEFMINGEIRSHLFSAILSGDIDNINYLFEMNSSVRTGHFDSNASDYVIRSKNLTQSEKIVILEKLQTQFNLVPLHPANLSAASKLLKRKLKHNMEVPITQQLQISAEKIIKKIHATAIEMVIDEKVNPIIGEECIQKVGSRIFSELILFKKIGNYSISNFALRNLDTERLSEIVRDEPIVLNHAQSISDKIEHDKRVAGDIIKHNEMLLVKQDISEKDLETIFDAIEENDWSNLEDILEKIDPDHMTTLLNLAIQGNRALDEILSYAEQGGRVKPSSHLAIVNFRRIDLLKMLQPYGLDLNTRAPNGYNLVHYAASLKSIETMTFLISNGVDVNSYGKGLDALDLALIGHTINANSMPIIRLLLENNANIKSSHIELVSKMFDTDLASYTDLVNTYPELRGGNLGD